MNELSGKVALITGGGRGTGGAIALALAGAGADVAVSHGSDDPLAPARVEQMAAAANVRGRAYQADIANEASAQAMVRAVEADFGHIDILVNSAGVARDKSFLNMTRAMWDEVLGVNLNGPFNVTNAVLRHMIDLGWGRIVNLCSMNGPMGSLGQANYTVTKGGLLAFTMTLARELARKGITVNAVSPGYVTGDDLAEARAEAWDQIRQMIPMGRLGTPEEIAAVVAFLAGPRASYITGQVISVNGGMYM